MRFLYRPDGWRFGDWLMIWFLMSREERLQHKHRMLAAEWAKAARDYLLRARNLDPSDRDVPK